MSRELQRLLNEAAHMIRKQNEYTARRRPLVPHPNPTVQVPKTHEVPTAELKQVAERKKARKRSVLVAPTQAASLPPKPLAPEPIAFEKVEPTVPVIDNSWMLNPSSSKLKRLAMLVEAAQYMEEKMERTAILNNDVKPHDRDIRRGKRTAAQVLGVEEPLGVKKPFMGEL